MLTKLFSTGAVLLALLVVGQGAAAQQQCRLGYNDCPCGLVCCPLEQSVPPQCCVLPVIGPFTKPMNAVNIHNSGNCLPPCPSPAT
ncbi:hypothetical protein DFH09DRAFT_1333195 [Mycena vulgaris]|nr:hypothetical protein DFH09DRAFT_1333195 [Mycena vulgaris]